MSTGSNIIKISLVLFITSVLSGLLQRHLALGKASAEELKVNGIVVQGVPCPKVLCSALFILNTCKIKHFFPAHHPVFLNQAWHFYLYHQKYNLSFVKKFIRPCSFLVEETFCVNNSVKLCYFLL